MESEIGDRTESGEEITETGSEDLTESGEEIMESGIEDLAGSEEEKSTYKRTLILIISACIVFGIPLAFIMRKCLLKN